VPFVFAGVEYVFATHAVPLIAAVWCAGDNMGPHTCAATEYTAVARAAVLYWVVQQLVLEIIRLLLR
jgi:hypothetical protein